MRYVLAILLVVHGVAHLPGFVGSWRLAPIAGMPYHTTVLAGFLDVGSVGIRAIGVLWVLSALGFWVAAVGVLLRQPWWPSLTIGVALGSLALCILEWPAARLGFVVNLVILVAVLLGHPAEWPGARTAIRDR